MKKLSVCLMLLLVFTAFANAQRNKKTTQKAPATKKAASASRKEVTERVFSSDTTVPNQTGYGYIFL